MPSVHLFLKLLTCGLLSAGLLFGSQLSNVATAVTTVRIPSVLLDRSQIQQISRLIGNLPKSTAPSFANPSAIFTPPHLRVNGNPSKSSRFVDTRNQDCLIGAIKAQEVESAAHAQSIASHSVSKELATSSTSQIQSQSEVAPVTTLTTSLAPEVSDENALAHEVVQAPVASSKLASTKVGLASAHKATASQANVVTSVVTSTVTPVATSPTLESREVTAHADSSEQLVQVDNLTVEPCELWNTSIAKSSNVSNAAAPPFSEQEEDDQPFTQSLAPRVGKPQDIYENFVLAGDEAVVQFNFEQGVDLYGGINYSLNARDKLIDQAQEQVINTGDMLVGSIYQLQQQLIANSPLFYFLTKSQVRLEAYLSAISSYFRLHNQIYEVTRLTVPAQELELLLETIELPDVAAGIINGTYHHQPLEDFKVKLDTAIVEYFRHVDNKQEFANNLAATCNQQSNDLATVICKVDYLSLILASQEISGRYTPVANTLLAYNDLLDRLWYDPSLFDNQLIQQRIKAYSEFMRLLATQKSNDWYAQAHDKLEATQGTYRKGLVQVYKLAVAGGVNPTAISYLNREQPVAQH